MSKFDKPTMRARFWELMAMVEAFDREADPLRQEQHAVGEQMGPLQAKRKELGQKIRELQASVNLGEIKGELSFISKGLAGKVGKRPGRE